MSNNKSFPGNSFSVETLSLLVNAINASGSGIIITDNQQPDNPIIFCNRAFEVLSGYKREEIIGHNCRFLQGDDRGQEARLLIKDAVEKGTECVVELRNYRKDGSQFWNELYLSPVKNPQGIVTHFIGVQNDISWRKKSELALQQERKNLEARIEDRIKHIREHEAYLETIIQTIRESLLVLDSNMVVLSANNFFYNTFKVAANETIGKKIYELGNGQWNIPALVELLEKVLPYNNPFEGFLVEHDFPHIGPKIMMLNARLIVNEGSYKNRILLALEDITDRVIIERRKDDFLSIASHELKTPLTTVKGYVQLMEASVAAGNHERTTMLISKTQQHIERLSRLITGLLDVTKIKAGKMDLEKSSFDFDAMIAEAVESVQAIAGTHTITVSGKTGVSCHGDMERMEQVVINLLMNAVKYSPGQSKVLLHVHTLGDFIKVSVTDYGVGVKPDDQKKIFERFYRADEVLKKFSGMGIGLYVCDQIVKAHGGTLWVVSDGETGATFSFTLPVSKNG
ncbi:PAS domain-containing sensor histidine kinase [Foetidibacter luteolus]|uniref:PAS domain-containing sensor histidine kinase n=1 Tax=Foetidibacter luteolus TaxID=2608880 RepID=UPI00129A1DF1|nr:ATP-binding protein [Foetidibacter luteolus]